MSVMNDKYSWYSVDGEPEQLMSATAARELQRQGHTVKFIRNR